MAAANSSHSASKNYKYCLIEKEKYIDRVSQYEASNISFETITKKKLDGSTR